MLFLLYNPPHLLKNIKNNWHTEKMQKLKFTSSEHGTVIAQWRDLVEIYKSEEHSIVKSTKLDYATLHPTSFEKQKVSVAVNVFNEKTVVALQLYGHNETATFVDEVTKLWNCINVKSTDAERDLNFSFFRPILPSVTCWLDDVIFFENLPIRPFSRCHAYACFSSILQLVSILPVIYLAMSYLLLVLDLRCSVEGNVNM